MAITLRPADSVRAFKRKGGSSAARHATWRYPACSVRVAHTNILEYGGRCCGRGTSFYVGRYHHMMCRSCRVFSGPRAGYR